MSSKTRKILEQSIKTIGPEDTKRILLRILEQIIDDAIRLKVKK